MVSTFHNINCGIAAASRLHRTLAANVRSHGPAVVGIIVSPTTKARDNRVAGLGPGRITNGWVLASSPLTGSLYSNRKALVKGAVVLAFFVNSLLPVVMVVLLNCFDNEQRAFSRSRTQTFGGLMLGCTLPTTLFMSVAQTGERVVFTSAHLALMSLIIVIKYFFFS